MSGSGSNSPQTWTNMLHGHEPTEQHRWDKADNVHINPKGGSHQCLDSWYCPPEATWKITIQQNAAHCSHGQCIKENKEVVSYIDQLLHILTAETWNDLTLSWLATCCSKMRWDSKAEWLLSKRSDAQSGMSTAMPSSLPFRRSCRTRRVQYVLGMSHPSLYPCPLALVADSHSRSSGNMLECCHCDCALSGSRIIEEWSASSFLSQPSQPPHYAMSIYHIYPFHIRQRKCWGPSRINAAKGHQEL